MKIKNWSKFQHFKDRRPLWIKLYRDLLDDRLWNELDPLSSKVLVTLWLLASEDSQMDGNLPDIKTIAWRMRMSEKQVTECVSKLSHWLVQDDINLISDGYQVDAPEKRREETEKEIEKKATEVALLPDWIPLETWDAFLDMRKKIKKPTTNHAINLLIAKLDKFRKQGQDVQQVLEKSITSGWQDVFEIKERTTFAQQSADIARVTVAAPTGPDPALLKIEQDRKKAAPMPSHIRDQINQVLRKTA
jgi:hypothetical protein